MIYWNLPAQCLILNYPNIQSLIISKPILMFHHPKSLLRSILNKSEDRKSYQAALMNARLQYQIKPFNFKEMKPSKVLQKYSYFEQKFYGYKSEGNIEGWHENELSVFVWVLIVYAYLNQKGLKQMDEDDYSLLSIIFNGKNPDLLEFQVRCLLKNQRPGKWTHQETDIFLRIYNQTTEKNKWNVIAKRIFIQSGKRLFRTPKQCREHWINHLDPTKIKTSWTKYEDYKLIQGILKYGKKWSKVVQELNNSRTQHMIKNRFNWMIANESKKYNSEIRQELVLSKIKQRLQSSPQIRLFRQQLFFKNNQKKQAQCITTGKEKEKRSSVLQQEREQIEVKQSEFHQNQIQFQASIENEQACEWNSELWRNQYQIGGISEAQQQIHNFYLNLDQSSDRKPF